ncbi:MAG: hypothetical protein AB7G11_14725 [Phycisphaerales bacterium]
MVLASGRFGLASSLAASAVCAATWLAPAALAQDSEMVTKDDVITGTMDIEFNTRTKLDTSGDLKAGSAALGAKDLYKFALRVADTTEFSGQITRQPNLFSKLIRSKKQEAQLGFKIDLSVLNPKDLKQKKTVGNWVGEVPIDTASGAFDLAGGSSKEAPLRIFVDAVGKQASFTELFGGRLLGKAENKESLASYTYSRLVGNKKVQVVVKKSDPMRFENIKLAKGPAETYPTTIVNGRLDYDYETGNWFTDGIRFHYTLNGKEFDDVVTGSIKWVEDPNRESNGKGYYEFNLRFNEEKNKTANSEGAAFEKLSDEDAFFAVDNSIPCLTGRVTYVDTMMAGGEVPSSSKVEYHLNANKLNKQQIMNFFKLWMICVGPTNDE